MLRDGSDTTVYLVDRALLLLPVLSLRNEGRFGIIDFEITIDSSFRVPRLALHFLS